MSAFPSSQKRKLLVIEDNDLNRGMLCAILEDDYQLLEASNGRQGLEMMRRYSEQLSIVLLDIQMPEMNGYEVLEVASQDPELQDIPIIVTTGNERTDEEERCLQLGAIDFIQKPYNSNIVHRRIGNIIRLREKTATLTEVEIDLSTGVYTRSAFYHYASQLLKDNPTQDYTLILTDIVGFQRLVELHGEKTYSLLRDVAQAIKNRMDDYSVCGHNSLEQYACIIPTPSPGMNERQKVVQYEKACQRLSKIVGATVKMGVFEHIDRNLPIEAIINRAEVALKSVFHQYSHNISFVNQELLRKIKRDEELELAMEDSIKGNQLEVYFQPKHHATSGKLLGAEVLLRWQHPTLGFVPPNDFVPIFEQTGFIVEADAFAWEEACRYLRYLMDKGLPTLPISVNTTRLDYESEDFEQRLLSPIKKYGVNPELLHIEITERLFSDLDEEAINLLQRCRKLGMKVELDDFGTGYSSLYSLAELPIDIVKFDRTFVLRLEENSRQLDVMKGCVNLVKRLNLKSVAEGVETEKTRKMINDLGIDIVQGYYFARPMPAKAFEEYLRKSDVMTPKEYYEMGHDPHLTELERLRRLAEEDPLTGLSNRYRLFHDVDQRLTKRSPFTLVVFDVDKFKIINDNFGHPVGDAVLIGVANTMRQDFKQCELIRLGGDEFAIIFDGVIGNTQMLSEMHTFFCHIQALRIEGMDTDSRVSLSAGYAYYRGEPGASFEHLYTQADKQLYVSKRTIGCCING